MAKIKSSLEKIYRVLLYAMPVVLYFSFWPWINFGTNNTMNFDVSLPLIWLVLFDALAFVLIIKKKLLKEVASKWMWLLLPGFLTISIVWSHDKLRSILIMGILWLLYFAVFAFYVLRDEINDKKFWRIFLRLFFGTGLLVCGWCLIQCIMDVAGLTQKNTLLCDGCVYKIFGFPHPNGFAAEPQFMGNLLLAPIMVSLYLLVKKNDFFGRKSLLAMFFVFVATLFLTLSRGAIYAFVIVMVFFTIMWGVKKTWKVMWIWPVVALAFLFTLNLQGIFSEVSKTDDTYIAGVNKVINQLTLGVVDFGGSQVKKEAPKDTEENAASEEAIEEAIEEAPKEDGEEAIFDGYVEVSTSSRFNLWQSALKTWTKDPATVLFGVGIGSGLISMYENGTLDTSREIINNQYVSFLFESGIVGIALLILSLVLIFRAAYKAQNSLLLFALIIAYMVSLMFFSGLPNALHIYLLTGLFITFCGKRQYHKSLRRG